MHLRAVEGSHLSLRRDRGELFLEWIISVARITIYTYFEFQIFVFYG